MDSPDYSRSLLQRLTGQRSDIPLTLNSLSTLVSESPAFDVLPMSDITNKKTVEHIEGNEKVHIQLDVSQVSGDCDESSFRLNESSDLLDVAFVNTTQMEICNKNIEDDSIDGSELVKSDDISRESGSGASISSSKSVRISETPTMPTLATSPAGTSGVNYGRGSKSPERKLSIQDISIDDAEESYSSDLSASGRRLTIRRRRVPGSRCKRITMQNLSHTQLQVTESIVTPHSSVRFTPERSRLGGVSVSPATMSTVPPPTTLTEVAGFSGSMQDTSQVTTPPTATECHAATPTNISNSRTTPSSAPSFETTSSSASSSNTTPTNVPHLGIKPTCDYRTSPSATISEPTSAGVSGCVTHPILPSNNVTPTSTPIQVPDITALEEKYGDLPCGPDVEPVVRKSKRRRTADFEITSQIVSPPSTTNSPADTDTVILPVLRTRQSRRLKRKSLELYTYDKSASTRRGSSTGEKKIKTPAKRQIVTEEDKPCSTTLHAVVEESSPKQSSSKTQIQPVTISQNISTETPSKNSIVSQVADEATERKTDLNLTAELENEEVLSGNLKRKTEESTHSSVQDCESPTSLRSGIDQETEDIYFNRLWESQMPQPKQWETIFEQPKCSKKATQIFGTKSITCKIDFDDFSSRPRVLSRRRRAAKRGFKLPTKRRFAQLQTRLELMDKIQDHNEESVIPEKITKPAKTPATPTRRSNRQQRNT